MSREREGEREEKRERERDPELGMMEPQAQKSENVSDHQKLKELRNKFSPEPPKGNMASPRF